MGDIWLQIGLVALLIALNAALAGSEIALVSLRDSQIARLEERKGRHRVLAQLARDPNRFLATIQIGITLAGFLASATAAVSLARPLIEVLSFLGDAARPAAIFVVTLIITFFTLVFGELAPKRVALQRAEAWGVVVARPLSVFGTITRPFVWVLSKVTDVTVRLMGGDPSVQREVISKEELRDMVSSRPGFHRMQREILSGAFDIEHRSLLDVIVPRPSVTFIDQDTTAQEALDRLLESGHSRAPVMRADADDIVGVVHLRDLIATNGSVEESMRPPLALPETLPLLKALNQMRDERTHFAIVVDEYGGTEGIITLEDILEEFVGEIYDEFDRDIKRIKRDEDGSVVVDGGFPLHDLVDVGVVLPEGPYSTVGGFIIDHRGAVPHAGDTAETDHWRLEILEVDNNHVGQVRITKRSEPADAADES
ncbi:MAG: hemolysin family protein [Actinomycetota bacterium]|nr:hemolysin family protein [Actinomycetota bacterium]